MNTVATLENRDIIGDAIATVEKASSKARDLLRALKILIEEQADFRATRGTNYRQAMQVQEYITIAMNRLLGRGGD